MIRSAALIAAVLVAEAALADSAPGPAAFARFSDPESIVLAVTADFEAAGGAVRLAVYADETAFLERAAAKHEARMGPDGVAVLPLKDLAPGEYAFVAYYDANGDGKLNRGGVLGRPKEPVAFSNGVKPKLRRPRFDEAKVAVDRGAVVVLAFDD